MHKFCLNLISNYLIYLFDFPMSNATMERTISTPEIRFYFIFSVCVKYVKRMAFGNSGILTSQALQLNNFRRKKHFTDM